MRGGSGHSSYGWGPTALAAVLTMAACGGGEADDSPAEGGSSSGGISATGGRDATTSGGTGTGGRVSRGGSSSGGANSGGAMVGGANATGGANSGGKAGAGGAATSGVTGSGGAAGSGTCSDECPRAAGLTYECKKRFALGVNYAWHTFSGDFGGIPKWNMVGVSQAEGTYSGELAQMAANGVSVVRWWMFPDFRGGGVEFDASNNPTGLSAAAKADLAKALDLAEANDLYLVLTLFSFDAFRPDRTENGITIRGMAPMVTNATRRTALIANIVRPAARAVAASPHARRLLGWDVINEPEWAVSPAGNAPSGRDFTPNTELSPVSLANMKALINESAAALHQETPSALVSAGWAAAKWAWAFTDVAVDFNQPHIYAWVNEYWPYTQTPAQLGYGSKPVVFGEFFLAQMPFDTSDTFNQILSSWWDHGYAGAWSWQFIENKSSLGLIKTFAQQKGCSAGF